MRKANSMAVFFFWCKQAINELENTACDVWNISETSNESFQSKQTLLAMDGRFVWPWAIAGKLNWIHIDIAICISFQTQFPLIFPPIIWKLARHSDMAWGCGVSFAPLIWSLRTMLNHEFDLDKLHVKNSPRCKTYASTKMAHWVAAQFRMISYLGWLKNTRGLRRVQYWCFQIGLNITDANCVWTFP